MRLWPLLWLLAAVAAEEHLRDLEISEGAPVGTRVGFIGDGFVGDSGPPYLIVPVPGSAVDTDLSIEQNTGEIRTKVPLDRETRSSYSLVAIPLSGENVRVVVRVIDENDNAPTFPSSFMSIDFPENTPRDVKRTLNAAKDLDLGIYNTQRYNIVSGNTNNAFRLSSHREKDGVLYLDLQINGVLDRETMPEYSLLIEALDGGSPPLRGSMVVNVTIQDVNDNQPIFNQSRYFASVPENATLGTSIFQVSATDADAGANGEVEYSINRRQSDKDALFNIDSKTGLIFVNKALDFETKEVHELVVVAKDKGLQPLETTAFVSIKVTDVNDNQPTINVIFLSDDATPKISEIAQPGEFVARISVNDPDSKTEYSNVNVTLEGGEGHFGLATQDNIIYLVIVSLPIDREQKPNYTLSVIATDTGSPPLHASKTFQLKVTDVNDNAPEFEQSTYHANVLEIAEPGTSVFQISAFDRDEGINSVISYSLRENTDSHPSWFQIDSKSGLITMKSNVDCETDPVPKLTVIATDNGVPPLSSSATVLVTIHDVNDNEPIFEQSFYNVTIPENKPKGSCILKVAASDPDCGVNAMVNYTLGESPSRPAHFYMKSVSGEICIAQDLDFESRSSYEFPVVATDRGGLSTTTMVRIQITDVNDNEPIFNPVEYNVSLRDDIQTTTAFAVVLATDRDMDRFGTISYKIVSGKDANLFRIDRSTGELFVTRGNFLSRSSSYHINVSAMDGGGNKCSQDAQVAINIINSHMPMPLFQQSTYSFVIPEDVFKNSVVGSIKAISSDSDRSNPIRYTIHSGDPEGYFTLDSSTGILRTAGTLDHEGAATLLLSVQASSRSPPLYSYAQVKVTIEDRNDNAPEFESATVRLSVPESAPLGVPLYTVAARDRDAGVNGRVRYQLVSGNFGDSRLFAVDPTSGHLSLAKHLDYETSQRHTLVVGATDQGDPPLASNLTLLVEVQDVNDNPPVFERSEYFVSVSEALPASSQILQVTAVDLDTGNNARITYKLVQDDRLAQDTFLVMPNSGWLSLKQPMDRETRDKFLLKIAACDNGTPVSTAYATVAINVLDANDNDPKFSKQEYEFSIEENLPRGTVVGSVKATDEDLAGNAALRYSLIPSNTSFQINPFSGEISSRESLDREARVTHELVAEARDQGSPARAARVSVRVAVTDVNDNAPELVDPQEDVISVREEQPPGTEVVRARAVDRDEGANATISYSILKGRDTDGYGVFTIDPISGVIRTRAVLDHEERAIYRIAVAATDHGVPARQTVRLLRVEVLDLNDNRPTFTSSSLLFKIREDVPVGFSVGHVVSTDATGRAGGGHVMYSLSSLSPPDHSGAFDIDKSSGSLVVARRLDRERCAEYKLEVRALDTSTSSNPQSSAVAIKIEVVDVNDNAPRWRENPLTLPLPEDTLVGSSVWNFTATDADADANGELRYALVRQYPEGRHFSVDHLTGTLTLLQPLDYETLTSYILVVRVTDQAANVSERLSATLTARVLVKDLNDNAPVFVSPSAGGVVFVTEQTRAGSQVARVTAVDQDSGDNGRVSYSIAAGNEDARFHLDPDSGGLTLTRAILDPDHQSKFRAVLNISATDHGVPAKASSLVINIVSETVSTSSPTFLSPSYHANISEDAIPGTYIIKLAARSPSTYGHNLTYMLPGGVAGDTFKVDASTGVLTLARPLDRETADSYSVAVHVTDAKSGDFDTANVIISVLDVNDNAPEFKSGSCYPVSVPENSEAASVHTYIATDLDLGTNSQITYSITGGNVGNKFAIDPHTGELTARPLDREVQAKYFLVITAQDRGSNPGPLSGTCNSTILVEDQNDNNPIFPVSQYSLSIPEDAPVGTLVQVVSATDADLGVNARLVFSLSNETDASFHIDNTTGAITTTTLFDRETRSSYYFLVVATDGGRYDSRSAGVPVHVAIEDVNDNAPRFSRYPFTVQIPAYTQPGHDILRIAATDADQGANAEVVYRFVFESPSNKFRINPATGVVSATTSLASEGGRYFGLEVMATDKGNPPLSATGLVEIRVGEVGEGAPLLRFQNSSYTVTLAENLPSGSEVLQVSAFKSDGRRQRISYSFGSGNTGNMFSLEPESGLLRVLDSRLLDYELHASIDLVLVAQVDNGLGSSLYGYTQVKVLLTDQNDNVPLFTQNIYTSSVLEGKSKGTFVVQVAATDADKGPNARLAYHIVDGNHDNAFAIEPSSSGTIRTNIVLDREIRDSYRLTVIVTDEGLPQLTGTAMVKVNIIDVNDNQPTFPPHSSVKISENKAVGSVLTAVAANDVDTNPPLTYSLLEDAASADTFSIDQFSGRILLRRPLDYEAVKQYRLAIAASDSLHSARTVLTLSVTDFNDNPPVFSQHFYQASIPELKEGERVLNVNATDLDSGVNAQLRYSLVNPTGGGFTIDEKTGDIFANRSSFRGYSNQGIFDLVVQARDSGTPPLSSTVPVRIYVENIGGRARLKFMQDEFRISVREDIPRGSVVVKVASSGLIDEMTTYDIISGDELGHFLMNSKTGELIVVKDLDRESCDSYKLWISSGPNSSTALVNLLIEDANDNTPHFLGVETAVNLSEGVPVGHTVLRLTATDVDLPPNSDVRFEITSGNEEELFALDPLTGVLSVQQPLDYDTTPEHLLILKVEDGGKAPRDTPLSSLTHLQINLLDENDNAPKFPISEYLEFVGENEAIGSSVFTARATDLDRGDYGKLNYSIMSAAASGYTDVDDSWKLFRVDALTGLVTTNAVFDYEARSRYAFTLLSTDSGGRTCKVKVRVEIESRDEFHPQFTERTFKFILSGTDLPVGYVVGHVTATDRDKGPDGRVVYQLTSQHSYFKVNRTTGAVLIKKKLEGLETGQDISLVITASSGRQGSLTNMSVVEIAIDPLGYTSNNVDSISAAGGSSGVTNWAITLLVIFLLVILASAGVFVFLHLKNRRQKKVTKPGLSNPTTSENNYVDPGSFDTIPIRGSSVGVASPPKYDEIPSYRNNTSGSNSAAATSELSASDQSGSSGRGSAEDGEEVEDEEIRMINEGRRKEEDNMSVHNTQEYLARLGIVEMATAPGSLGTASAGPMEAQLNVFEEADADVSTLIYAKLSEVGSERGAEDVVCGRPSMTGSLSSIVHSEEELTGSYNWDYLLDWGPQYQPLAHVFSEIARLKDDAASVKSGASGASSSKSKSIPPVVKTLPPPLLTNVAPRSIAAPLLAARPSHLQPQLLLLPRSPISHDPASFPTSAAMSPSFSPSLSPLANRSPSISPLHPPGVPPHHIRQRHQSTDNELRI